MASASQHIRSGPPRLIQLDVLRGIAILLVLGNHQFWNVGPKSQPFRFLYEIWGELGWTGVDLFFVLSGFLIGSLLFNELRASNHLDISRFLTRRILRIWPAYYTYIAFVFLMYVLRLPIYMEMVHAPENSSLWFYAKFLVANVINLQSYLPTLRPHTWSLAVEEHFYLTLPFVLVLLTRRSRATADWSKINVAIPVFSMVLILVCGTLRFLHEKKPPQSFFATHLRIDELFFGVMLSYWNCLQPGFTRAISHYRAAILTVGLFLVAMLALLNHGVIPVKKPVTIAILLSMFGYGAVLMAVVTTPLGEGWLGRALESRPSRLVAYIGTYSYAIYLWHLDLASGPLNWLCRTGAFGVLGTTQTWVISSITYVVTATTVGVIMSFLIEEPVLRLRDRFFPRRTPVITEEESGDGELHHPAMAPALIGREGTPPEFLLGASVHEVAESSGTTQG